MTIWWSPTSASYALHCKFSERGSRLPKEGQWQNRWVYRNIFTQDVVWEVINASQLQPSWRRTWKKWGRKKRKSCKQSPNLPSNSTIWKRKTGSENLKQLVISTLLLYVISLIQWLYLFPSIQENFDKKSFDMICEIFYTDISAIFVTALQPNQNTLFVIYFLPGSRTLW